MIQAAIAERTSAMAEKNVLEALIGKIKAMVANDDRYTALSIYMNEIKREPEKNPFGSKELLAKLASEIIAGRTEGSFTDALKDAEAIYKTVFPLGEKTENYSLAEAVFLKIFDRDGIYFNGAFSAALYGCFYDKTYYIEVMYAVLNIRGTADRIGKITEYAMSARQFFSDERAFGASVINAADKIASAENVDNVIKRLLEYAERSAGIYDIDENSIASAADNVKSTERMLSSARKLLDNAAKRSENFSSLADSCENNLKSTALAETENLRREASESSLTLKKEYEELLNEERKGLEFDRDKLLRDILDSADSKIRELKIISESIKSSVSAELYRISSEANKSVDRAAAMLQSDELKNIISDLKKDEGLIEKIVHVEAFSKRFDEKSEAARILPSPAAPTPIYKETVPAADYDKPADMTVNYYFNESIPFAERMEKLMEKKRNDIAENNAVYHKRFDDVLTAVIEDANPYLIGPSGCGKTFLTGQLSKLLGLEILDIGYINEEYDIMGFQTASGGYNYPAFYRAYKFGAIVFCDEFDNSNSRAAVKLNSFMANGAEASCCFPNGERVLRHPNFRIIAAGNTSGNGADRNYSTREKIEESVQQRFTAMYVGYDNRLEKQILTDYPKWFEFAEAFRRATDAWSKANDVSAPGIFTTRDAANIKKYLDHRSFSPEAIIDYEFIETKDNEYLAFLERDMSAYYKEKERISSEIFGLFEKRVAELRANGGIR